MEMWPTGKLAILRMDGPIHMSIGSALTGPRELLAITTILEESMKLRDKFVGPHREVGGGIGGR